MYQPNIYLGVVPAGTISLRTENVTTITINKEVIPTIEFDFLTTRQTLKVIGVDKPNFYNTRVLEIYPNEFELLCWTLDECMSFRRADITSPDTNYQLYQNFSRFDKDGNRIEIGQY